MSGTRDEANGGSGGVPNPSDAVPDLGNPVGLHAETDAQHTNGESSAQHTGEEVNVRQAGDLSVQHTEGESNVGHTNGQGTNGTSTNGNSSNVPLSNGSSGGTALTAEEAKVLEIYIDDCTAATSTPSTQYPGTSDYEFSDPSKSKSLLWFSTGFGTEKITVNATADAAHKILPNKISLDVPFPSPITTPSFQFTTDEAELFQQFNKQLLYQDAKVAPGRAGYDDRVWGQVMAFKTSSATETIKMKDFVAFLEFECVSWVNTLLGAITLKPRVFDPTATPPVYPKSAIWYQPEVNHTTTMRLEMEVVPPSVPDAFNKFIQSHLASLKKGDFSLGPIYAIGKKTAAVIMNPLGTAVATESELLLETSLRWKMGANDMRIDLTARLHKSGMSLILQFPPEDGNLLEELVTWLGDKVKAAGFELDTDIGSNIRDVLNSVGSNVWLRQVALSIGEGNKLLSFKADFEVPFRFGAPTGPTGSTVALLTSLSWLSGSIFLDAKLFVPLALRPPIVRKELNPLWESYQDLEPRSPNAIDYLSIPHMFDPSRELDGIPKGIPTKITEFSAEVGFGSEKSMRISATIQCDPVNTASSTEPPKIAFDELDLAANYNFGTKEYGLTLAGAIALEPHPDTKASEEDDRAVLRFSIEHQPGGKWVVSGKFSLKSQKFSSDRASKSYKVAHVGNFFTSGGIQKAVMNLMSEIQLSNLEITYQYDKGSPSSFIMDGTLWLGEVALKLNYTHRGSSWSFEADLEPEDTTEKVSMKDILKDVLHDFSDVPDFVANMTLPLDQVSIKLRCKTAGKPPAKSHVVFSIDIEIKDFYFTFAQIQNHETAKDGVSKPLRILRFALTKLPTINSIPLVSKLEQPFDELGFIWLSQDLIEEEATILNSDVFSKEEPLRWKNPKAVTPATNSSNVILPMGSHFQIVILEKQVPNVILDYVFGTKAKSGTSAPALKNVDSTHSAPPVEANQVAKAPEKGDDTAAPSSKTPMKKTQGPLKISNVALKYAGGKLHVLLDAMVKLGPLEFELIGFSVILDISKFSIHDWSSIKIEFSLDGLGVEVKEGKFVLAGLFERIHSDTQTGYAGGLSMDVTPYGLLAAGAYIENSAGFKTVFAFAMLTGPLMEFGWAEVRGITGGFGFNSDLRLPDITQVPQFPLLSHASNNTDPLVQLSSLTQTSGEDAWITARDKTIWVAAGLTVKALQILDVQAVVTIELGDDFKIALIGEAVAQLPRGTDHPFLLLDLDIIASLDVGKGTLQIEAQLSPASFLLDHDCHPTGGFALCAWFKGSEHAGDWVFTVGGFHPLYQRPDHYPDPPRLGISWQYDSHLSISGGSYFAITPKVCMAGMQISAIYDLGRLSASFDAHADMLMQYQPFQYMVEVGVSMSINYELKAFFVSHKFYAHASAKLSLMGPPMVGSVHVDISVVNFTIAFGARHGEKPPLTLEQFWASLKQASDSDAKEPVEEHIFAVTSGLLPSPQLPAQYLGVVRAGNLELQIQSRGALSEATYVYDGRKSEKGSAVFAKPMRIGNELTSKLKIGISRVGGGQYGFLQAPITQSLPSALWTAYDERLDPKDKGDNTSSLNNTRSSTVEHLVGLSLKPPPPLLSPDIFPAFSVKELMRATASFPGDLTRSNNANAAFQPGSEKASKEKMRGLWGSQSGSGSFDVNEVLGTFAKELQKTKSDVAARFMNLSTRPPKKLFDHFDRFYSSGAPSLAYTIEKPSFDATIAGRWSMADEEGRSRDESAALSTVRFPDIFAVGNTSADQAESAGKSKRSKPILIVGLSRINVQPVSDLQFSIEVARIGTDAFQMKVPFGPTSVIDDLEAHWIATYHPKILSGTCKFTDATALDTREEHEIIKHVTISFPEGHFRSDNVPVATAWLTGVHFSKTSPPRVEVSVIPTSTSHEACTIMFRSWGQGTELQEATCSWIAYPHSLEGISSGRFATDHVHAPDHPTRDTSQVVRMNRGAGQAGRKPPRVVVGLNKIDCAAGRSLRLAVSVGSVGSASFRAHISTWGYSVLYSAGATWIALDS